MRRRWPRRTPRSPRWPAGSIRSTPRRPGSRTSTWRSRDTVANLTNYKNTVYYAVGTKDELIKRGVITKEGSKFLVFGGTKLMPARNLDPASFTAMDKTTQTSIPLPRTDKKYKIVSRQSTSYLGSTVTKDGKVSGTLQISQPEEFWGASKYLILVQD